MGRRCIGLNVHREFAQLAVRARQGPPAGKIGLTAEALRVFYEAKVKTDNVDAAILADYLRRTS